ncbi:hypothetical protein [Micromonospora sediminicola]|uniref:hypothetical protein n=1 Tax=Micromonospora sediminicola TaxID=946078 RepID=UPI003798D455
MVGEQVAAAELASIAEWNEHHLDEDLTERDLFGWLPELGVAIAVHGDDVGDVADHYRYLLEERVAECTGGAVVVSDVVLLRESDNEWLHFVRNGESVWWRVEHESDDYVDQAAVAEQINDLDPGGDDPRRFYQLRPVKKKACDDDVYVLASPDQARALHDEFGLDFYGLQPTGARRGESPTDVLARWLSEMEAELDRWWPQSLQERSSFDFSVESLDALERLVLDRFADWAAVQAAADDPFVIGAVRYLGETLIRSGAGRWAYPDAAYGPHPLVESNTPPAFRTVVEPLHKLSRVADDRERGILSLSVEELRRAHDEYTTALRALESSRRPHLPDQSLGAEPADAARQPFDLPG